MRRCPTNCLMLLAAERWVYPHAQAAKMVMPSVGKVERSATFTRAAYPALIVGTEYSFRVKANNGGDWSNWSGPLKATKKTDVITLTDARCALCLLTPVCSTCQYLYPNKGNTMPTCSDVPPSAYIPVSLNLHLHVVPDKSYSPISTVGGLAPHVTRRSLYRGGTGAAISLYHSV